MAGARGGVEDCFAEAEERGRPGPTTRSAATAPGTGTSPCPCSRTPSSPSPRTPPGPPSPLRGHRNLLLPAETQAANPPKRGPDTCGQLFAPPRTYAPPAFITNKTGRDLIPLTAAEARRLFNLHTRAARPAAFHEHWSDWRRHRQAAARKSHYTRRLKDYEALL